MTSTTSPDKDRVLKMASECGLSKFSKSGLYVGDDMDQLIAFYNRVREEAIREAARFASAAYESQNETELTCKTKIVLAITSLLKDQTP